jgi:hypothetical protein
MKGSRKMADQNTRTQGGTHEQHVRAGEQSHKNNPSANVGQQRADSQNERAREGEHAGTQGGSHEQHVKAGQQSHKNS